MSAIQTAVERLTVLRRELRSTNPYPWHFMEAWIAKARPINRFHFSDHFESLEAAVATPNWVKPRLPLAGQERQIEIDRVTQAAERENRELGERGKLRISNFIEGLLAVAEDIEQAESTAMKKVVVQPSPQQTPSPATLPPTPPEHQSSKHFPKGWKNRGTIGEGGQAQVFVAIRENDPSDAKYALKVLRKNRPRIAYERFLREIEAVKKLDHPSIVKIIEHSKADDSIQFYVMEYIEGARSLKQLLKTKENQFDQEPLKAMRMFIDILDGLKATADAGIIHRDLSPANVLVLPNARMKLIDFGLCDVGTDDGWTATDEAVGTPAYRPPESTGHQDADPTFALDLYSAGKILWAAVTNKNAFDREEPAFSTCSMQAMFPNAPRIWHLQHILERTIRKEPADRWRSLSEAIIDSWRVYRLIEDDKQPIQDLDKSCPICGWGALSSANTPSLLLRGGVHVGSRQEPEFIEVSCNYCGYCFIVNQTTRAQTLAKRQKLS